MTISEPYPQPISQMPAAGSDAHHPLPVDTDFLPGIVWDPNKKGPGVGGWVGVKVSYAQIFNLPINTAVATGLIEEVNSAKAAALTAMAQAMKSQRAAKNYSDSASSEISRAAGWASIAAAWFKKSKASAIAADLSAKDALAASGAASIFAGMAQKMFYKTRREFTDDQIALKAAVFNG